jgi:hypothetical protein
MYRNGTLRDGSDLIKSLGIDNLIDQASKTNISTDDVKNYVERASGNLINAGGGSSQSSQTQVAVVEEKTAMKKYGIPVAVGGGAAVGSRLLFRTGILTSALIGAAAGGGTYYMMNKNETENI